ncbi:DAZ-associated protein 1-like isoform X1 [Amphibalanus amphitrite]|uniref:DAZ-associated protein 1-like n=1 Tax=Amphibalanus amphitrite TaxID=1232801 RepID=UPI001C9041FC|nr:DAZ-associated protein 1-like [Amphibalanus amphitrite]XP_043199655.1 DAZ-associated protein 1-like isoform X1 [Amphibalanus amphitrite]
MRPKTMRRGKNDDNEEAGKMFVGGLSWETTQDSMLAYFSQWGEVVDCVVMKNNETGRSRGFGFVTFAEPDNVQRVLAAGPHELDGRTIDPKACNPRSLQNKLRLRSQTYPKVFLGGLPPSVTETDLRTLFGQYGHVMEVVIMYDQEKRKSRGFGFLSFELEDAVERVLAKHFVTICGKQVEVKRAEPREASKPVDGQPMQMAPTDGWRPPQDPATAHWGMPGVPQQLAGGGGVAPMPPVVQWGQQQQPFPQQAFGPPAPGPPQPGYPAGWAPAPPPAAYAAYGQPPAPPQYQQFPAQTAAPQQWAPQPQGPPQPQHLPPSGGPSPMPGADPYGRMLGGGGPPMPPAPVMAAQKPAEYAGWQQQYGISAGYAPPPAEYGGPRPPQHQEMAPPAGAPMQNYGPGYAAGMPGGDVVNYGGQPAGPPGPQRGGNYNQPVQTQLYHPYRHSPYAARR